MKKVFATLDFKKNRNDFPMLATTMHGRPLLYLDSAATSLKPQVVIDTMTDFYQNTYGTVHRAVYQLSARATERYNAVRSKVRQFLNALRDEEIVFTRGTTDAINLVASSFGKICVESGDEVLITEMEHHSNIVPWQLLCKERGAVLKVVPINDSGEIVLEEYRKALSKKTKIVAISHVSNVLGTVNPVKEMIVDAHSVGAKVLVDGAQSVPHLCVDVQDLDADFYVFSSHKVYGPTGAGVLYGKYHLLEMMPPYQGGGDMIETVTFEQTTYADVPVKFEAGTPMIAEILGMGAAIDYFMKMDSHALYMHEQHLLAKATDLLLQIPSLRIIGSSKEKSGVLSFVVDGVHPLDLGMMLDLKGIAVRTGHHCAQPVMQHFHLPATVRLSFALYNTEEEILRFFEALQESLFLLNK